MGANANMNILKMAQQCSNVYQIVGSLMNKKSKSRQIHAMLGFQDTGQFVKVQCTFVQGVTFSNSSDLNENGLKLLHVIQGTTCCSCEIVKKAK